MLKIDRFSFKKDDGTTIVDDVNKLHFDKISRDGDDDCVVFIYEDVVKGRNFYLGIPIPKEWAKI